jgi:hypothetical protein
MLVKHWHDDVDALGGDEKSQGRHHPKSQVGLALRPQVWKQRTDGLEIAARAA